MYKVDHVVGVPTASLHPPPPEPESKRHVEVGLVAVEVVREGDALWLRVEHEQRTHHLEQGGAVICTPPRSQHSPQLRLLQSCRDRLLVAVSRTFDAGPLAPVHHRCPLQFVYVHIPRTAFHQRAAPPVEQVLETPRVNELLLPARRHGPRLHLAVPRCHIRLPVGKRHVQVHTLNRETSGNVRLAISDVLPQPLVPVSVRLEWVALEVTEGGWDAVPPLMVAHNGVASPAQEERGFAGRRLKLIQTTKRRASLKPSSSHVRLPLHKRPPSSHSPAEAQRTESADPHAHSLRKQRLSHMPLKVLTEAVHRHPTYVNARPGAPLGELHPDA
eukprot:PhM_4_TR16385/c0_g1_i1/m.32426